MKSKGFLMVVSGPSGAGKGTICQAFFKKNTEVNLSVSATTRKPRNGEVDAENYFFISKEKFMQMIEEDQLLEHVFVFDNYYGTPKEEVLEKVNNGDVVILEIEIEGAKQIKEKYPEAVMIFILPPSIEELSKRIQKRGTESEEEILKRLNRAWEEINTLQDYSYFLINDNVDECVEQLTSIMKAEQHSIHRNIETLKKYYKGGNIA